MTRRALVLIGERPKSWNYSYAGQHWSRRALDAVRTHDLVRSMLDPADRPFEKPVRITYTVYFKDRPLDAENIMTKAYTDGFLAHGNYRDGFRSWLWDDDMRYVAQVTTIPKLDPDNPRVEIVMEEVDG